MTIRTDRSRQKQRLSAAASNSSEKCAHQWVIDPPDGPTSEGHCKLCGGTRSFRNSLEISYWDNQRKTGAADRSTPAGKPAKGRGG